MAGLFYWLTRSARREEIRRRKEGLKESEFPRFSIVIK